MAGFTSGSGVARDCFFSVDAAEIERFMRARFSDAVVVRPIDEMDVEFGYETLAAGDFALGHTWTTAATTWDVGPMQDTFVVQHVRHGAMTHDGPVYGEVRTGADGIVVVPPVGEFHDTAAAFDIDLVALDAVQVARFAEHAYGIVESDLRVTGLARCPERSTAAGSPRSPAYGTTSWATPCSPTAPSFWTGPSGA